MLFDGIPRVQLCALPTPLEPLDRLTAALGGRNRIYIKRDDHMSLGTGGNKLRSLEFWLAEGMQKGCDVFLAAGLPQSNLCRLTAAACCRLGLECRLIHNADGPEAGGSLTGNPLLNELMGVRRVYCGAVDEHRRADFDRDYAQDLRRQGRRPYIVGDPVLGAMGYVQAGVELASQLARLPEDVRHIFISASAGPTEVGLLFGLCLFGGSFRVHLVSVEYDAGTFWAIADDIFQKLRQRLGVTPAAAMREVAVFYGQYLGEGYARPTPAALEAVRQLAALEGIFMETTYNAKVLAGLCDQVRQGAIPPGEGVCVIHTGGTTALFGQGSYFVP